MLLRMPKSFTNHALMKVRSSKKVHYKNKNLILNCVELIQINGEKKFLEVLEEEFGGWPMVRPSTKNVPLMEKMINLRKLGFKTLIDIHVTLNPKNPQALIIKVFNA